MAYDYDKMLERLTGLFIEKYGAERGNKSQFARDMGVTRQSVQGWLDGSTPMTLDKIIDICDRMGWDFDHVVYGPEETDLVTYLKNRGITSIQQLEGELSNSEKFKYIRGNPDVKAALRRVAEQPIKYKKKKRRKP